MSSGNCRPSCPGLNMLTHAYFSNKHVQGVGCCPPTVSVRMSDLTRPQYLTQHLLIYGRRNPRVNRKNLRTRGLDWDTNWNHIPRSTFWLVSGTSSSTTWWNRIELAIETLAVMWGSSVGKRSTPGCDVKALQLTSKRIYNDIALHDDVIKWRHFPRYWSFVRGIHRCPVKSPHKGQWRGALSFSLICAWINGWVNNRKAGDLRRHRAHYDVSVMKMFSALLTFCFALMDSTHKGQQGATLIFLCFQHAVEQTVEV